MIAMCQECWEECGEVCEGNGKCGRFKALRLNLKIKQINLKDYEDFEKKWEEMREIWREVYRERGIKL